MSVKKILTEPNKLLRQVSNQLIKLVMKRETNG